jgi:phage baseplate assembly protein W
MAEQRFLGEDLHLGFVADEEGRVFAGPYSRVDLQPVVRENVAPRERDLQVIAGKANLIQSLILRLKTERGELAGLGHPDYGSRHYQLVGEPNTETNRNLVKLYVLECLKQEPRLVTVEKIQVKPVPGRENRDKIEVTVTVKMKAVPDSLSFVVPFSFESTLA